MNYENLFDNIQDFFKSQYKDLETTPSFLAFEPIGHVLDDISDSDAVDIKTYMSDMLSFLADKVPAISDTFLTGTEFLSDIYSLMVASSSYLSNKSLQPEEEKNYKELFQRIRSDAEGRLADAEKASILDSHISFLKTFAFPDNWYDPTSNIWQHYTYEDKGTTTARRRVPTGLESKMKMSWKSGNNPVAVTQPATVRTTARTIARTHMAATHATMGMFSLGGRAGTVPRLNKTLLETIGTRRALVVATPDTSQPPKSPGFKMSFDYSIITLDRHWLSKEFFSYSRLFYCLSQKGGEYSTGEESASNNGRLKAIPTAFIAIKNLAIEANWSPEELAVVKNSWGFGFFNLQKKKQVPDNNSRTLLSEPVQIIGWICEVLPKMPFNDDPNFSS